MQIYYAKTKEIYLLALQCFTIPKSKAYTAFTLTGFDDQERNLTFVKTNFQVLKFKFLACSMKQAFYTLHKQNIARD